ncbi:hypothetical protein F4808DRAFT_54676 [Astrocystis sublimbata]|nr:hypothetical protein F4808DRAFT_54676 [Astrocystis sublimbata]
MSDPATKAIPVVPPPCPLSTSVSGERRSWIVTASPPSEHGASCSAKASVGSSSSPSPRSPPSLPSSISKAPPSVSGSRFTATSPPTTISGGLGPAASVHGAGAVSTATMPLNPNMPSRDSQLHVAEARAALVASMSNMLDSELQSRASLLHANAAQLSRQEQDVTSATEALRKENDKLAKVAKDAGRKIKELGNVQNWAEVLERDFLVLEETMRLVRHGGAHSEHDDDDEDTCSECSSSYWSGSESEEEGEDRLESRKGSRKSSRKSSVDELRRQLGNKEEDGAAASREKGKGLCGSTVDSDSSTVGGGSTYSNATLPAKTSNVSGSTKASVSLDEAILESLTEALSTDMHLGAVPTERGAS